MPDSEYPIAAVSRLTGVSCHALRVWERRYGFPVPSRSPSGHRRYRHDQVVALQRLSELAKGGRSIGDLIADLLQGRLTLECEAPSPLAPGVNALDDLLDRLSTGDIEGAERSFARFEGRMTPADLLMQVVAPALVETGDRWFRRRFGVFQERCVSGFLRRKVDLLIEHARRENPTPAHTIIVGSVQGDRHEGGVLIINLLLEQAGWRVHNLGVDLPVSEFGAAVDWLRADALALSFVLSRNITKRFAELSQVKRVPVFVGRRSMVNYQKLARSHGLIPLPGPAVDAVTRLVREFDVWTEKVGRTRPSN
ncbi:MAG: MerR family transcriptional regulator [Isosphaeraceae bacterium]